MSLPFYPATPGERTAWGSDLQNTIICLSKFLIRIGSNMEEVPELSGMWKWRKQRIFVCASGMGKALEQTI